MAKKGKSSSGSSIDVSDRYWTKFLRQQNLLSSILDDIAEYSPTPTKKSETTVANLSDDMETFVWRVAERLTPLDGLDLEGRRRALKIREQFRKELARVFLGKEDYNAWFDRTRTKLGLHLIQFVRILHECLEGLRSEGAKSLRAEYEAALKKLGTT